MDPYRESGGTPCLRCQITMIADKRQDLACPDGCGTWIAADAILRLVGTPDLVAVSRPIQFWRATPLAPVTCPSCKTPLAPVYTPLGHDVLTLGQCLQHGAWIDRGTHDDFETAYHAAIERQQRSPRPTSVSPKPRSAARTASAEERIEALEARVGELERVVAALRAQSPTR